MLPATRCQRAGLLIAFAAVAAGMQACSSKQQPPASPVTKTDPPPRAPATEPPQAAPAPAAKAPAKVQLSEREKIDWLLDQVANANAIFIRNGEEASGKDAAAHLRRKWSSAGDRIKTAREFIEHLASKSSTSGQPYHIRTPDGVTVESREWFTKQLDSLESR